MQGRVTVWGRQCALTWIWTVGDVTFETGPPRSMQNQSLQEVSVQIMTFVHCGQRMNLGDYKEAKFVETLSGRTLPTPAPSWSLNAGQHQPLQQTSVPPAQTKVLYLFVTVAHTSQLWDLRNISKPKWRCGGPTPSICEFKDRFLHSDGI